MKQLPLVETGVGDEEDIPHKTFYHASPSRWDTSTSLTCIGHVETGFKSQNTHLQKTLSSK